MTRQITKQAQQAFRENRNFKLSNTEVHADCTGTYMYLFGNLIARKVGERVQVTLAGWDTLTTRERLHNLTENCKLSHIKGKSYIQGKEISTTEWVQV